MARIDQYPECTTPDNNDLLLIETEEGTKKVKKSTLLKDVVDLSNNYILVGNERYTKDFTITTGVFTDGFNKIIDDLNNWLASLDDNTGVYLEQLEMVGYRPNESNVAYGRMPITFVNPYLFLTNTDTIDHIRLSRWEGTNSDTRFQCKNYFLSSSTAVISTYWFNPTVSPQTFGVSKDSDSTHPTINKLRCRLYYQKYKKL